MKHIDRQRFARHLRRNPTSAETKLWGALRKRCLSGFRFNRQVTIGPYVVDFLCREAALVVEVDGATHGDTHEIAHDEKRTQFLETRGFAVFRATNTDVYENLAGVLESLDIVLRDRIQGLRKKPPPPSGHLPHPFGAREGEGMGFAPHAYCCGAREGDQLRSLVAQRWGSSVKR